MRSLTTLEASFLERLKEAVQTTDSPSGVVGAYVTDPVSSEPSLQIGLRLSQEPALVYFRVLIYGTRPVRYHLETKDSPQAAQCRGFWNHLLGALNLIVDKSGVKDEKLHLFYEVGYTDRELKKLREK